MTEEVFQKVGAGRFFLVKVMIFFGPVEAFGQGQPADFVLAPGVSETIEDQREPEERG